jgi:hypothetical protein
MWMCPFAFALHQKPSLAMASMHLSTRATRMPETIVEFSPGPGGLRVSTPDVTAPSFVVEALRLFRTVPEKFRQRLPRRTFVPTSVLIAWHRDFQRYL